MLVLNGTLIGVFESPQGTRKDGTRYGGEHKAQILAVEVLQNGEERQKLVTLTVETIGPWKALQGAEIAIPVGCYATGREVAFTLPKGAVPQAQQAVRKPSNT